MGILKIRKKNIISSMVFPPIVEFAKMIFSNDVLIDQHEHYIKRSSRNRYSILSPNGVQCLTIPLTKGKNRGIKMSDVRISHDTNWENKHVRAIHTSYGSAPFFPFYIDALESLFNAKHDSLFEFNSSAIKGISKLLNIPFKIVQTDKYYEDNEEQIITTRNIFHPKEKAIESNLIHQNEYQQVFSDRFDFVPNLSILDLMFCLGPESGQYLKAVFNKLDISPKNRNNT